MKKEIIRYHKVTCKDHEHLVLNQLDFSLYEKEVLGIVGLQTAWCEALCQTLTGMRRIDSGWIECMGEKTFFRSWQEARRHGIY